MTGDRVAIARLVQLRAVPKGKHELVLSITENLSGESANVRAPFEIH